MIANIQPNAPGTSSDYPPPYRPAAQDQPGPSSGQPNNDFRGRSNDRAGFNPQQRFNNRPNNNFQNRPNNNFQNRPNNFSDRQNFQSRSNFQNRPNNFQNRPNNNFRQNRPNQYSGGGQRQASLNRSLPVNGQNSGSGLNGDAQPRVSNQERNHTAEGVCWYHETFGVNAFRCNPPCTYRNQPQGN